MTVHTIGESYERVGGRERVTGAQRYAADLSFDHVLHVKLVHLPCARAAIRQIETHRAAGVPGVACVLTAADLPQPVARYGPAFADRPILATGETKFFGEPVAAVVAETGDAAAAAAALVGVEFDELPAVLSVEQALDPASPLVQDPSLRPNDADARTNVLRQWTFGWGEAPASPHLVLERDYRFPMVTHFAIEPHVFVAVPTEDGITIVSPIQHPFVLQRVVAAALGWPLAKVRIIAPDPGGGFGGKGWPKFEPLVALLALRLGRPVRLVLTLEETFQAVRRTSARIRARTGVRSRRAHPVAGALHRFSDRRLRRHRRARRQQGQLRRVRPVPHPARARSSPARSCRIPRRVPPSAASARRRPHGRSSRS